MENPIKMDDLGGKKPYFWVDTHLRQKFLYFASALAGTIGFQTGAFSWSSR